MIITIAVGAGVVSRAIWVINCASTWFTIWVLFAWIMGAVHTYFMEYFIQCISKIWKSAYFFRQYSTQLDIVRCSSTIFNSCDFERKDFIYSIPIYWENLILIF